MPCSLRLERQGGVHHIIDRGNYRQDLFVEEGSHPSFQTCLFEVCEKCQWELEGFCFFAAHRDTEKAAGMFSTLVITPPSAHEGGDLIIRHAGRETVMSLRNDNPGAVRYAAFYTDCEHEVKPVVARHRVGLIYNLIWKAVSVPRSSPGRTECDLRAVARRVDVGSMSPAALRFELGTHRPDRVKAALQAVPAQSEGLREILSARLVDGPARLGSVAAPRPLDGSSQSVGSAGRSDLPRLRSTQRRAGAATWLHLE